MPLLLLQAFLRHLRHHPVQLGTTLAGIALGVGVSVAVDLANASATAAFDLSVAGFAGSTTHQVLGGPSQLDETFYPRLRASSLRAARTAAPVVEGFVLARPRSGKPPRRLHLLGIDPLVDGRLRAFTGTQDRSGLGRPGELLAQEASVALATPLARELGLAVGDMLQVEVGGLEKSLRVSAFLIEAADSGELQRDLLVADIASAQEILGMVGRLSRVDLQLDGAAEIASIEALLPADAHLRKVEDQRATLDEMTAAFRLNLTALSWLAWLVGLFLIYNTLTFLVVERRPLIGRLRAMGVTHREVFGLVLAESAILGAIGTSLGLAVGIGLAQGLIGLVSQAINDLYFAVSVRSVSLPTSSLVRGAVLGLAGSIAAAWPAAREAAAALPRTVLLRSDLEQRTRHGAPRAAGLGFCLLVLACLLLAWPTPRIDVAFAGLFAGVLGYSLFTPLLIRLLSVAADRAAGVWLGLIGRWVARGIAAALSRTGVAVAALTVAISATLGVDLMVGSFRNTLIGWLDHTLQADYYLAGSSGNARGLSTRPLDPRLVAEIAGWPEIEAVATSRRVTVASPRGPISLHALGLDRRGFSIFQFLAGESEKIWPAFAAGEGVLISEPFAWRQQLQIGSELTLQTDHGPRQFLILGIFEDFSSDRGYVAMARATYDRHYADLSVQSVSFSRRPASDAVAFEARLDALLVAHPELFLSRNRDLKKLSLAIFDRTFTITRVLKYLAVGVAFLGIVSALMALQLERSREAAILRALGLTPGQLWALVVGQTGLLGLMAGLLALPLGTWLAALLVHVINKRSFGWTLHLEVAPSALLAALVLAGAAALLAGLYPAWRIATTPPAVVLREE